MCSLHWCGWHQWCGWCQWCCWHQWCGWRQWCCWHQWCDLDRLFLLSKLDKYISYLKRSECRKYISWLRVSAHNLRITTGRQGQVRIAAEERLCKHSKLVDTEPHFCCSVTKSLNTSSNHREKYFKIIYIKLWLRMKSLCLSCRPIMNPSVNSWRTTWIKWLQQGGPCNGTLVYSVKAGVHSCCQSPYQLLCTTQFITWHDLTC